MYRIIYLNSSHAGTVPEMLSCFSASCGDGRNFEEMAFVLITCTVLAGSGEISHDHVLIMLRMRALLTARILTTLTLLQR